MLTCKLAFVTLATSEFDQVVNFYAQLLEQEPSPLLPDRYAEFEMPGLRLGIFRPKASHNAEFLGPPSSMSLCLEVANLEAAIARLTELGYPPPAGITTASHGREVYAYDPAQNRLILHQSS